MGEELRRIELEANPPIIKHRELTLKEKLHFWWAKPYPFVKTLLKERRAQWK